MNTKQPTWQEEFDEQFTPASFTWTHISDGVRTKTRTKKFIARIIKQELSQQRKEIVEEIKENFEDTVCLTDKENNKAFTTICFKGTGKGASLFDIITKLSSEDICQ